MTAAWDGYRAHAHSDLGHLIARTVLRASIYRVMFGVPLVAVAAAGGAAVLLLWRRRGAR